MEGAAYLDRRARLLDHFDRTAHEAWARMTSEAPLGRVRATVRAGREAMRETLLSWLPADLSGARLLDAGCGTGALALEAARRGAEVAAVDLSPRLVALAEARAAGRPEARRVRFLAGDMLSPPEGGYDHVVAMDSLIHYAPGEAARAAGVLASRARASLLLTHPPRTPALALMHLAGRLFPRADRAPAIEPVAASRLLPLLLAQPGLAGWRAGREAVVSRGFYVSRAQELRR